jgi:hypothetical protein
MRRRIEEASRQLQPPPGHQNVGVMAPSVVTPNITSDGGDKIRHGAQVHPAEGSPPADEMRSPAKKRRTFMASSNDIHHFCVHTTDIHQGALKENDADISVLGSIAGERS